MIFLAIEIWVIEYRLEKCGPDLQRATDTNLHLSKLSAKGQESRKSEIKKEFEMIKRIYQNMRDRAMKEMEKRRAELGPKGDEKM